jgi:pimeloyl-ACP methyl ester carboxylesterase
MQALVAAGYTVFAVGFPHKQGDQYDWAEVIGDASQVIRARTGTSQIDLIGWSLGAFAARLYASGLRQGWGTPYASDVRRLILVGNPNTGFDYLFRHGWWHSFMVFPECGVALNEPSPDTDTICYGVPAHHPELTVYATNNGDYYPGQRQMLARLDGQHALPLTDQDWYTTYNGGQGFSTKSYGIDVAIEQGSLVAPILAAGLPASVATYLLCGDSPTIPVIHNEHTGPSDGVVFLDGCLNHTGVANLAESRVVTGLNHLELGWAPAAMAVILGWLGG